MDGLIIGLLLPFAGTTLGAACVFLMKKQMPDLVQKTLLGFASGVMVAASVWSLLIPSIEMSGTENATRVIPAVSGFIAGIAFLLLMDRITPHLHLGSPSPEGPHSKLSRTSMLVLAVTLHNIPEGMAGGSISRRHGTQHLSSHGRCIGFIFGNRHTEFPGRRHCLHASA